MDSGRSIEIILYRIGFFSGRVITGIYKDLALGLAPLKMFLAPLEFIPIRH